MNTFTASQAREKTSQTQVLIAEDNKDLCHLFARFLEQSGYRVKTATNGEEALILLETEKPHLVVLDLNMPFATGLDVLQYIRLQRGLSSTKVMIVTGSQDLLNTVEAQDADVRLLKPINMAQLVHEVRSLMDQ